MLRLVVFFLGFIGYCFSAPSIGLTNLYYSPNADIINKPVGSGPNESQIAPTIARFNKIVIDDIMQQLSVFQIQLKQTLNESGEFSTFDATPTINDWISKNPRLLAKLEEESKVVETDTSPMTKGQKSFESSVSKKNGSGNDNMVHLSPNGKLILIGWVNKIKANEIRQEFQGTSKTSVIYNLNIEVNYKLVDYDTKQVITQFVAAGHAGIARILPTSIKTLSMNAEDNANSVATDSINSLLFSVKHGLLIKEDMGVIPK